MTVARETVASRPVGAATAATIRLADGTGLSWDEVVGAFGPPLAAYARSRGVRDPEDLVQDVFLAAVERAGSFQGDLAGLRSLLFMIAFRRIADEHRRRYRRPEVPMADYDFLPDLGPTADEIVGRRESAGEAMEGFAALTQREQHVLRLRIFGEATPGAVGESLGLTPGNVRVIQTRALKKLRAHMRWRSGEVPVIAIGWAPLRFLSRLRRDVPTSPLPSLTTEATSSVVSFLNGPALARLGAAVSVAALSVGSVLPNDAREIPPGPVGGARSLEIQMDSAVEPAIETHGEPPGTPPALVEPDEPATSLPADLPAVDAASDDAPINEEPEVTTTQPDPMDNEGRPDEEEPVSPADEPPTESVPGDSTGSPVQPLADEVVDPLLDDVVQPLVGGVVEVVEETVQPVVDDVVDPLVDDVVDPLLEGITEPLLEEGGVVEDVEDLVEETASLVESLLGFP